MSSSVITKEAIPVAPVQNGAPGTMGSAGTRTLRYAALILFVIIILIPLYVILVTSLKPAADVNASSAWNLPTRLSLEGWSSAWSTLAPSMYRSLILAVSVAVISSALGAVNGFVFAKWSLPGIADDLHAVPVRDVHPLPGGDDPAAGDVPEHAAGSSRGSTGIVKLIMAALRLRHPDRYADLPQLLRHGRARTSSSRRPRLTVPACFGPALDRAADLGTGLRRRDDLAVHLGVERLPVRAVLSRPAATARSPIALNDLAGGQHPNYNAIMAGRLLASLPTLLVYILLGRYFIGGLMSGSVK